MATRTRAENKTPAANYNEPLDKVFDELSANDAWPKPVVKRALQRETPVEPKPEAPDWTSRFLRAFSIGCVLLGAVLLYRGVPSSWRASVGLSADSRSTAAGTFRLPAEKPSGTKRIQDIRVGDRVIGRNPIREEVEGVEPDPATWRKISLHMTKAGGLGLWIELLRPIEWVEEHDAKPGSTVYVELHEMGAEGDAEVTAVGPCPRIQPGDTGTVVTGTFKHQAGENSNVVHLKLEDQIELTGVTNNHAYWSVDRQDFIEVGSLRVDELIDTEYGRKHVVSITPIAYTGFLYNLETNEHVYRVGSLGTLVHNSYLGAGKLTRAQSNAYRGAARDLWQSRVGRRAIWDNMDVHHRIPLEWAHKFPRADPNRAANLVGIDRAHHPRVNRAWSDFKTALGGRDPTAAEVMKKALDIDKQFGNVFTFLP